MAADMDAVAVAGQVGDGEYLRCRAATAGPHVDVRSDPVVGPAGPRHASAWTESLPTGTLARLRDALAVHRALDALGAAARLLEMTVAYAGQREQFGAAIGSFQAVKHHCADMALAVEAGRVGAVGRGARAGHRSAARSRAASAAAAYAKSAAGPGGGHRTAGARRHRIHLGARPSPAPAPHQGRRGVGRHRRPAPLRAGRPLARGDANVLIPVSGHSRRSPGTWRGRPSPRSAIMLRMISELPPAMVYARAYSDSSCQRP